jgi:hypothetical protein
MPNPAVLTWLVIGGVLAYVVAVDENVYHWIELQAQVLSLWFQQRWFLFRYNPRSFWVKWEIQRNANRIAKQFIQERDETNE